MCPQDLQTFIDATKVLGFPQDHRLEVSHTGTIEASMIASSIAEALEEDEG